MPATERDDSADDAQLAEQLVSRAYAELRYRQGFTRGAIAGALLALVAWILLDVVLR